MSHECSSFGVQGLPTNKTDKAIVTYNLNLKSTSLIQKSPEHLIHLSNHCTPLRHRATPPPCRASAPVQLQGGQLAEQQRRRGGGVHEQEAGPQEPPLRVHLPSGSPVGSSPDGSGPEFVRFRPVPVSTSRPYDRGKVCGYFRS